MEFWDTLKNQGFSKNLIFKSVPKFKGVTEFLSFSCLTIAKIQKKYIIYKEFYKQKRGE